MPTFKSTRVVTHDGVRPATVRHEDGAIVAIGDGPADDDFGDLVILPGLVDTHVHVNEPGRTEWEGFATATRAAAAGGTTSIVDMPLNSIPPTVTREALDIKRTAARGQLFVDVAFWGGIIPGSLTEVEGLAAAGVRGFKLFMVDSGVAEFPPVDGAELRAALEHLSRLGRPALIHAESAADLVPFSGHPRSYSSYLASRPPQSEAKAIEEVAELVALTGARTHVLHVSSADATHAIATGPWAMSGETCPHYLTFAAEDIPDGATQFKCAPPIRPTEHREALWEALRRGILSMVVSDHSPAPADLKALDTGDFSTAWGGIASLQLRLPALWTGAVTRGVTLEDLADWLASGPAMLAGLHRKGSIDVGKDADFVVFDPDGVIEVNGHALEHRHPVTPYEGMTLRGSVVTTILRGTTVFDRNRGLTGPSGRMRPDD